MSGLAERVIAALEPLVEKGSVTRDIYRGEARTWIRVSSYAVPADSADNAVRGYAHHYQVSVFSDELDPEEKFADAIDGAMLALGFSPDGVRRLDPDGAPGTLHYMSQWAVYEEGIRG